MSWIILIVAGLLEVCFAFCLGKTKETVGNEYYLWGIGCGLRNSEYVSFGKSDTDFTDRYSLSGMDRYRSCRYGVGRDSFFP